MKKLMTGIVIFILTISMLGCGKKEESSTNDTNKTTETKKTESVSKEEKSKVGFSKDDCILVVGETQITLNSNFSEYKEKLGDPLNITKSPNCLYDGEDSICEYDGYTVYAFMGTDMEKVYEIDVLSDTVATKKGIKVGMSKEEMEAVYGKDYVEEDSYITYTDGDYSMEFFMSEGVISDITILYEEA